MKKILGGLLAIIVLLATYVASVVYTGKNVENTLAERSTIINRSGIFEIVSRDYQRNWISADETIVVRIKPQVLSQFEKHLPKTLNGFLQDNITMQSHVQYGPWLGDHIGQAQVTTQLKFSENATKMLKQLFGDVQAVSIQDEIAWNGSGSLKINISPFDYQELSGIHWVWKGLESVTQYSAHYQNYQTHISAPNMTLTLADLGEIAWNNLAYRIQHKGNDILPEGNSVLSLQDFLMKWDKSVDHKIQLNELINMVSDLQIGAFINPTVSAPPSEIHLKNFRFEAETNVENDMANMVGKVALEHLRYGESVYQNLNVIASAQHIHAKALQTLKAKMAEIANAEDEQWRQSVLTALRQEGAAIFTHNPTFQLERLNLETPAGLITMNADFTLRDVKNEDLEDIQKLLPKIIAHAQYDIPQALPEKFTQSQIQQFFHTDNDKDWQDMQETIRAMVQNTLDSMHKEGLIQIEQERISGNLKLENRRLLMNDHEIELPQPENEELEEEDI